MALMHVNFFSNTLGMCVQMDVIIPQRTIEREGCKTPGKYPTLYLLHGMSDDHTIWQRRTSIERYADQYSLAVVMPSTHLGWYTDLPHGGRYWTYISEELPAICRDFFPSMSDKREETFAAGLSMGGYGAMKLGLRASDTFSKVASLSGGVDAVRLVRESLGETPAMKAFWENTFGPADKAVGGFNDLFAAAEELKASGKPLPEIYMWCGHQDFLYQDNLAMRDHLNKLGYSLTYEEAPGDHQWKYWDEKIQTVLTWLKID